MQPHQNTTKDPLRIRNYSFFGAIVWTILLAIILSINVKTIKNEALKRAYTYTQVGFEKDVLYRRWASEHGGVYLKIDSATQPNPYLSQIPDRDIIVDSNFRLTLLNPAYMSRQVYELQEKSTEVRGHITSLKPIRGENAPDAWEIKALNAFKNGENEYSGIDIIDGIEYFRFMKPFMTEESCLKCHAQQGYKLNDIRGGVSIAYPMSKVAILNKAEIANQYILYILLWVLGIGGIILSYFQLIKNDNKRILAEESLKTLNSTLEEKVEERSQELLKSQSDWENIFNTLDSPAQLIDKNHIIKYVNEATVCVFNLKREDLIGKTCYALFHLSSEPPTVCPLEKALKENTSIKNEMLMEAFGTSFIVSCSPIYSISGEIESFMHIMTDITERKQSEQELSIANAIINRGPAVAFLWENKEAWPIEFVSENVEKLTGYCVNDFMSTNISYSQIIHNDDIELLSKEVAEASAIADKKSFIHTPYRIITKSGEIKWVNDITFTRRDEKGAITHFEGIIYDNTEYKLAEEKTELFSRIIKESLNEIYLFDYTTLFFTDVNSAGLNNLGYTLDEMKKITLIDIKPEITPEIFEDIIRPLRKREKDKIVFETVHQRKDKSLYNVEVHMQIIHQEKGDLFAAIIIDITNRKAKEKEFQQIFNMSIDMISTSDISTNRFIKVNPAVTNILGYSTNELEGKEFHSLIHPDDIEKTNELIQEEIRKGKKVFHFENRCRAKNGEYKTIEWSSQTDIERGINYAIAKDITERKQAEEELKKHRDHLEELISERTKDLNEKNKRLEEMNHVFVGRELRMAELKEEIEKLKKGIDGH